jgi:hypothetical protein
MLGGMDEEFCGQMCEVVPAIIDNPALMYVVDDDAETGIVLFSKGNCPSRTYMGRLQQDR